MTEQIAYSIITNVNVLYPNGSLHCKVLCIVVLYGWNDSLDKLEKDQQITGKWHTIKVNINKLLTLKELQQNKI